MKKFYLLAIVLLSLASCQIAGLTSGYSHLSKKEQAKIINYKGKIDEIHDYSNIYTCAQNGRLINTSLARS